MRFTLPEDHIIAGGWSPTGLFDWHEQVPVSDWFWRVVGEDGDMISHVMAANGSPAEYTYIDGHRLADHIHIPQNWVMA